MNRFITAALAACTLLSATAAQADINLLDRQIVSKNGTVLGTLYLVIDTADGARDDAFVVMEGSMAFPPPMDFVVLAPNLVDGDLEGDEPLRQVNNWKLRPGLLHKGVDDGDCGTIYQKLYRVSAVTTINGIFRPTNDLVAVMGERNACASEGRLRWFVDSPETPANTRPMPQTDEGAGDLYFEAIDEFGPTAPVYDWYARSWLPAQ